MANWGFNRFQALGEESGMLASSRKTSGKMAPEKRRRLSEHMIKTNVIIFRLQGFSHHVDTWGVSSSKRLILDLRFYIETAAFQRLNQGRVEALRDGSARRRCGRLEQVL